MNLKHSISPLIHYKGRYNRKSWEQLKSFGTLFILVDTNHFFFDVHLRSVEQGDIITSINDGISYVVLSVSKLENTNITKWINIQPLFSYENWYYEGLFMNMVLDGIEINKIISK